MSASDPVQSAVEHHRAGRFDEAEALYRAAIAKNANEIKALHLLGTLLIQTRRPGDAVPILKHGAAIARQSPDVSFALAEALRLSGAFAESEAAYRRTISLRALFPQAHNGLGLALVHQGKLESAVQSWQRSIQLKSDYAEALANLGAALAQLKKPSEAAPVLQRAVQLNPTFAPAHNNLANVLDELEQIEGAITHWTRAIELDGNYFDALVNLGKTVQRQGRHEYALELLNRAVALNPDDPDARFLRGLAILLQGRLVEGFDDYAWRMKCKELNIDPRNFVQPAWDGTAQPDKIILLRAEQGFGDTIQFVRYAPLVKVRCGQVVLECQSELAGLMKSVSGIDVIAVRNSGLPAFDMQAPLLDLPHIFKTTLETVPSEVPYLLPDPERVAAWMDIIASDPPGKRIGLVWSGNPAHGNDRNRSITLHDLDPLADATGVTFFSLQKGPAGGQVSDSTLRLKLVDHTARLTDFTETASLISNLDLVITVDTSIAHLAGAMGKSVWVLLPFAPDWRWMVDRTDSPWYPTMRLFRQPAIGDWKSVVRGIHALLDPR